MRVLSKESFGSLHQLLANYGNLYSMISTRLPKETAACFAKYTMLTSQGYGQWSIACEGEDEYQPVTKANPGQRFAAREAMKRLEAEIKNANIVSDPDKLLTVPDESCIFFRQDASGKVDIVLTQWGFRKVGASGSVNEVSISMGDAGDNSDYADVNVHIQWSDETPLAQTKCAVSVYGATVDKMTDDNGDLHLGSVANGERITVEADGQKIVPMVVDIHRSDYTIVYPYYVHAIITVVNDDNEPQETFINVNGEPKATDSGGSVAMKDIVLEKDGALIVDYQGKGSQKFPLNRDSERNRFVYVLPQEEKIVPPVVPDDSNEKEEEIDKEIPNELKVKIRLLDKKGNPLPYARVRVDLKRGFEETVTDGEGCVFIEHKAFTHGEKVKIKLLDDGADKIPAPAASPEKEETSSPGTPPPMPS